MRYCIIAFTLLISVLGNCQIISKKDLVKINDNFYASKYEVSNSLYQSFLNDLLKSGKKSDYDFCKPNTSLLQNTFDILTLYGDSVSYYENIKIPFHTIQYAQHEAFAEYPVVAISYEAAMKFCKWLTKNDKKGRIYSLPTEKEWEFLSSGKGSEKKYPGGYDDVKASNGKYRYNFKPQKLNFLDDGHEYTAKINLKQFANKQRIFHLGGNVAEMVAEKGIAKGGSWYHEENELGIKKKLYYFEPNAWLGFRFVVTKNNN